MHATPNKDPLLWIQIKYCLLTLSRHSFKAIFVFARLCKVLVVFTLVLTLGAHWALLQTIAWTTMLANNLQSCNIRDAMVKTFDGHHPCSLCRAIAAAKKSDQKKQISFEKQKLEFPPVQESLVLIAPSRPMLFPWKDSSSESIPHQPPTPPPRTFFV